MGTGKGRTSSRESECDTGRTQRSGTGLGLPIARRNVELSGGAIEVSSEKGVGTVVSVRLPRA